MYYSHTSDRSKTSTHLPEVPGVNIVFDKHLGWKIGKMSILLLVFELVCHVLISLGIFFSSIFRHRHHKKLHREPKNSSALPDKVGDPWRLLRSQNSTFPRSEVPQPPRGRIRSRGFVEGGCQGWPPCSPPWRNPYHPWDWYIYLREWLILLVNVGKYTIHGCYGLCSFFVGCLFSGWVALQGMNNLWKSNMFISL